MSGHLLFHFPSKFGNSLPTPQAERYSNRPIQTPYVGLENINAHCLRVSSCFSGGKTWRRRMLLATGLHSQRSSGEWVLDCFPWRSSGEGVLDCFLWSRHEPHRKKNGAHLTAIPEDSLGRQSFSRRWRGIGRSHKWPAGTGRGLLIKRTSSESCPGSWCVHALAWTCTHTHTHTRRQEREKEREGQRAKEKGSSIRREG